MRRSLAAAFGDGVFQPGETVVANPVAVAAYLEAHSAVRADAQLEVELAELRARRLRSQFEAAERERTRPPRAW